VKIFTPANSPWAKVNFVDGNNVVVGFDLGQSCCESFGYSILSEIPDGTNEDRPTDAELEPYFFDTSFAPVENSGGSFDEGGSISFRLVAEDLPPLYLTLFNAHNGYYSHGFEYVVPGQAKREGSL
jgi:hypothetical protein